MKWGFLFLFISSFVYASDYNKHWQGKGKLISSIHSTEAECESFQLDLNLDSTLFTLVNIEYICNRKEFSSPDIALIRKDQYLYHGDEQIGEIFADRIVLTLSKSKEVFLKIYENELYYIESTFNGDQPQEFIIGVMQ